MLRLSLPRALFAIMLLAALHLLADADQSRLHALSAKVKCDCGCGAILGECPHQVCKRRPVLKQELSDGIGSGNTDEQILKAFSASHGAAMLVVPLFVGFDKLLWIVPIIVGVLAAAVVVVYRVHTS